MTSSSLEGFPLDPSKCNNLSLEEKRGLVHEISQWSNGAPEILRSWSRRELLKILCAEMGKERKYTGLTKPKMIEHLLKVVSENKSTKRKDAADLESQPSPTNNNQSTSKRQRKTDNPSRIPPIEVLNNSNRDMDSNIYCQNLACKAALHQNDAFCKRCSCCICYRYDDNKDPSLWLVCSSEPPFEGDSCGMSCHLECAIKHERSGIPKDEYHRVSLNFVCSCWRKQLLTAKDTRRVDVLCYRVHLSQKLLLGSGKYRKLNEIVETAAKKLEAEVGSIAGSPVKMGRGIVNRLSSGPDIQKLCACAVESLDCILSSSILQDLQSPKAQDSSLAPPALIRFENVSDTSLTFILGANDESVEEIVGYNLWHRKANMINYSPDPTCTLFVPNSNFLLSDLSPATEYVVKVVPFNSIRKLGTSEVRFATSGAVGNIANTLVAERDESPTTNSSSLCCLSNPSSEGDESNNNSAYRERVGDLSGKGIEEMPGDSISALDEERTTWEVGSVHDLTIKTETHRNSLTPTTSQNITDIPKPKCVSPEGQFVKELSTGNGSNCSGRNDLEIVPYVRGSDADLVIVPSKTGITKDSPGSSVRPEHSDDELHNGSGKPGKVTEVGSSTKKKSKARLGEDFHIDGSIEKEYALCVKTIRQLECEGYLEKTFRLKFLTWYSMRATPEEKRVVKVFVDTFVDDPQCLAGQLIDTFSDDINSKRPPGVLRNGFCMRLFH
ncbi:hypothetical protein IFM89_012412 [Coptis chinensis]|uniref:Fibronectin type-III domain-containing protein n=1 Tax=Coptis chinensis TaxID=261450 RepID=A0A835IBP4_9MAGN|nr:hypothetical protein IFM89_012412 [Coptis chinensis]